MPITLKQWQQEYWRRYHVKKIRNPVGGKENEEKEPLLDED